MPNLHIRLRCGNDANVKQTVTLPHSIHAQHLTLQSVVVSCGQGKTGSEIDINPLAVIPDDDKTLLGTTTPLVGGVNTNQGLHGIMVKLGNSILSQNDNIYAGSEQDHLMSGYVYCPVEQHSKTTVYNPQTVFGSATFPAEFDVELFYADAPQYPLTTAIEDLHSVHLTFTYESGALF